MSAAATVCVARLDLKVEHRDLVHPFHNDLEDALRTAELPYLPSGARLFIRRLRLGRIPAGLGRQALSRYLDARLGTINYVLALPGEPPVDRAEAVLVPDLLTGAALALDAIDAGEALPWYLRELFKSLAGISPAFAAARIAEVLISEAGPQSPGRLAETFGGGRRLIQLLNSLSNERVRALLAGFGAVSMDRRNQPDVPAPTSRVRHQARATPHTFEPSTVVLDAVLFNASPAARREITMTATRLPVDPERLGLLAAWLAAARGGPSAGGNALAHFNHALAGSGEVGTKDRIRRSGDTLIGSARNQAEPEPDLFRLREPTARTVLRLADPPEMHDASSPLPKPTPLEGAFSNHAGLWLLLAALRLAGVDAAEEATGMSLGHTLMSGFADRLGLGEADPARACLAPEFDDDRRTLNPWLPRPDLLRLVSAGRDLCFTRCTPGKAVIGLRHGRGILAVAGPREFRAVRSAGCSLRAAPYALPDISSALRPGLMLMARRLVSRATGAGWRRLVARRGRIVATNTHLDIEFDARDADPAVRIAGFDLDPGWVPWLGRVVCFHYDYSKMRAFPMKAPPP